MFIQSFCYKENLFYEKSTDTNKEENSTNFIVVLDDNFKHLVDRLQPSNPPFPRCVPGRRKQIIRSN